MKKLLIMLTLVFTMCAMPVQARQGKGHDKRDAKVIEKCHKFVNCHDARDGRWEGHKRHQNHFHLIWRHGRPYVVARVYRGR